MLIRSQPYHLVPLVIILASFTQVSNLKNLAQVIASDQNDPTVALKPTQEMYCYEYALPHPFINAPAVTIGNKLNYEGIYNF